MIFVDIIGDIAANVRAEYDATNLKRPFYLYGHPLEIFGILSEKDKNDTLKFDKYPLIALFIDYKEDVNSFETKIIDIKIVIMTETDPDYKAPNRYSNTFTPTLIPIYDLFIKYLKRSRYVKNDDFFRHDKFNRLYWGKGDEFGNMGSIGNDALDAVVISGLNLILTTCND